MKRLSGLLLLVAATACSVSVAPGPPPTPPPIVILTPTPGPVGEEEKPYPCKVELPRAPDGQRCFRCFLRFKEVPCPGDWAVSLKDCPLDRVSYPEKP